VKVKRRIGPFIVSLALLLGGGASIGVHPSNASSDLPQPIAISIARDGFRPVDMLVRASHNDEALVQLVHERPDSIKSVPDFTGQERLYGFMRLGEGSDSLLALILDVTPEGILFYVDRNRNLDLTDDPEPQINLGSGTFATEIEIPFQTISDKYSFPEYFKIWIFTNGSLWNKRRLSHYSRTQLKGIVELDGVPYDAWIVDTGANDGNLTNDAICLDLNRNRKLENDECFLPHQTTVVDGRKYSFNVSW
jgi:hypothetical protein